MTQTLYPRGSLTAGMIPVAPCKEEPEQLCLCGHFESEHPPRCLTRVSGIKPESYCTLSDNPFDCSHCDHYDSDTCRKCGFVAADPGNYDYRSDLLEDFPWKRVPDQVTPMKPPILSRSKRQRNRRFDLVGVEENPGPVGKKLTKLVNQLIGSGGGERTSFGGGNRRKSNRRRGGKSRKNESGAMPGNNTRVTGVPAAFGFVAPRSYYRTSSTAQRLADQDSKAAIRVHGCALYGSGVKISASAPTGSTGSDFGGFNDVATNQGYAVIAPTEIDPRLAAVSQTYQYYAFRKIVLRYIPFVGTSTPGGLYMAIAKDPEQASSTFGVVQPAAGGTGGTAQDVMDYDPSVMTAVWQPAMTDFQHQGVALWETYPNGEEPADKRLQAAIVLIVEAAIDTDPTSGVRTVLTPGLVGHLWLEYEIDFYVPGPPLGAN